MSLFRQSPNDKCGQEFISWKSSKLLSGHDNLDTWSLSMLNRRLFSGNRRQIRVTKKLKTLPKIPIHWYPFLRSIHQRYRMCRQTGCSGETGRPAKTKTTTVGKRETAAGNGTRIGVGSVISGRKEAVLVDKGSSCPKQRFEVLLKAVG